MEAKYSPVPDSVSLDRESYIQSLVMNFADLWAELCEKGEVILPSNTVIEIKMDSYWCSFKPDKD